MLDDHKRLAKIVLETSSNDSVLYFKVMHMLGSFQKMVKHTVTDLSVLASDPRSIGWGRWTMNDEYSSQAQLVLEKNWKVVMKHQEEAAERVLLKINESKNEVNSLMDGVSIQES